MSVNIEEIVARILAELRQEGLEPKAAADASGPSVINRDGGDLVIDLADPTLDAPRHAMLVDNPYDADGLRNLMATTSARLGVGRAGPRPRTATALLFQADHGVTQDAIYGVVSDEVRDAFNLFTVTTRVADRGEYLLRPDLGDLSSVQFQRAADAVDMGERAAEAMLPQLRRYAVSAERYAALRARQHRRDFDPGLLAFLDVEPGQSPSATRHVAWATESLVGKPFDLDAVERQLGRAYGDGRFETIDYRLVERDGRAGLEIVPQQKPWDAFGKLGLQVDDNFNGLNNYLFSAELVFNNVNRLGAKWRNLVQLGRVTGLRTEVHQQFGRAGAFYLEPSGEIRAESLPLWEDGREQVAEYRMVGKSVGLEAGYSPLPQWRLSVQALAGRDAVRRLVGDETLARTAAESYAGVRLAASWDTLDSIDFPTKGVRATGEWLSMHPWGGTDTQGDVARVAIDWALSRGRYHLLLGTRLATTPGDETFFQAQNFLGGFLNLSGFNEKALVGNQLGLLRAAAYRRLGDTGQIFAVPTYLGASVEAGNVWNRADDFGNGGLIVGGSVFLGFGTPLGPLFLGYGRNDARASSFYLTFGSLLRRDDE